MERNSYIVPLLPHREDVQINNQKQEPSLTIDIISKNDTNQTNIQQKYIKLINKIIERTIKVNDIYMQYII